MNLTPLPQGFRAGALRCGIRRNKTKDDLGLLVAEAAFPAAALFTRNQLNGAHVPICREHLAATGGRVRAVLVNSGNANCATGRSATQGATSIASTPTASTISTWTECWTRRPMPIW